MMRRRGKKMLFEENPIDGHFTEYGHRSGEIRLAGQSFHKPVLVHKDSVCLSQCRTLSDLTPENLLSDIKPVDYPEILIIGTLALQSFQGVLIVVSHDRSLLEATTDSFLLIDKGRLKNFDGDLNDYRQWRLAQENAAAAPAASAQSQSRKDTKRIEAQIRQEKARRGKPIQQKIDRAEKEMAQLSEIQTACEAFLAQEDAYLEANKEKLQDTLSQLAKVKTQLAQIEEVWLACQEELERIETEIEKQFAER